MNILFITLLSILACSILGLGIIVVRAHRLLRKIRELRIMIDKTIVDQVEKRSE